ncbi:uncharacterized protein LOC143867003 [Tasmannia lanceolata]|uniref:uncharacterized protein LOC143867003 n=1 Tax=Tasmannia lanceolata TaxID=3420 RepID=UPI004064214B
MWLVDHCSLCIEAGETIDHIFVHFKVARSVWSGILSRFGISWVFPSTLTELVVGWEVAPWKKKGMVLWNVSLLAVLWVLWKERNSWVFESIAKSPYFLFIKAMALVISLVKTLPLFRFTPAFNLWEGWKELMGNPGPTGIGGVLRASSSETIWAFWGPVGTADASEAEVRAAHQGLKSLNRDLLDKTIVEGDSLKVVRWLKGVSVPPWRFAHLFYEIQDKIGDSSIILKHIRRLANDVADRLARQGAGRESLILFDFLPP